jgi:hypothetical protein
MLLSELKDFKTKLEYHHELNPSLWENDELKPEVKEKLLKIADNFIEHLDVPVSKIKDIVLTGSNVNYNWTKQSDIDLHIQLDDADLDTDALDAKKDLWNEEHHITLYGFPVEAYVEGNSANQSGNAGIYSLQDDKWIREPTNEHIRFDYEKIKQKAAKVMKKIDKLVDGESKDLEELEALRTKIKESRRADLAKGGEFTMENLVFKTLRNNNYLDKLFGYIRKLKDEKLSLK